MAFTFFFRDTHTLNLIEEHVISRLKSRRCIDIWDAGCATGAEPYTLAILLAENMGEFMFRNVKIYASDLNNQFDEIISKATYPEEQVKRIPKELFQKYFIPTEPGYFKLIDSIRRTVSFQEHNLTTLRPIRDGFNLIVCKNVLLHLNYAQRLDILCMFRDALCDDGFLAVEQTQKMLPEAEEWFQPVSPGGSVYQRVC